MMILTDILSQVSDEQSNISTQNITLTPPPSQPPQSNINTQNVFVTPPPSQPPQNRRDARNATVWRYRRKKKAAQPGIAKEHNYDTFREADIDQDLFEFDIGKLGDVVCKKCKALRFRNELNSICCSCGDVRLPAIPCQGWLLFPLL